MRKTPLRPSALAGRLNAQFQPSNGALTANSRRRLLPDASRARSRLLLSRALSDAADPLKKSEDEAESLSRDAAPSAHPPSSLDGANGFLNGAAKLNGDDDSGLAPFVLPLANAIQSKYDPDSEDVEHVLHDIEFTAQRIGFPMVTDDAGDAPDDGVPALDDSGEDAVERLRIREESREHATAKAERVLAILRHSMTELDISKVIHRVAQYATLPRVTALSRKQFLRSLENRFGPDHRDEYEYFLAFLQGKDDVLDGLEADASAAAAASVTSTTDSGLFTDADVDAAPPAIMGLHPELAADPQFIGIVFCYCRLACLNSLKLVQRPSPGQQRGAKSSLWQVKNDFRKVLDTEGLSQYADLIGLEKPSELARDSSDLTAEEDAEWQEFNLENDRIDFRMLMAQTQELIALLKRELPSETIAKMLITMLASLKTSKLHRKIFQEMVCNLQTAFPAQYHEEVLSSLVPFLSGNNATFADFDDSALAANTLQHHRMRHEAILRALLECRMRVGHLLIHDIDSVDPSSSVSLRLSPEQHEKVVATAWNLVNVLDDRQYHMFFSRFLKYKLAWRPNRATFGQTFLKDIRKTLGPRTAALVMPLFEQTYNNLSVETLTICRVKARHARKLLRAQGELKPLDERARQTFAQAWQPERSVFYRNLPHGVTEKHLRDALAHVGDVERFFLFADPVVGAPDEQDAVEDPAASEEDEDEGVVAAAVDAVDVIEADEDDEEAVIEDAPAAKKKASARGRSKALKTPKRKTHVIASDTKTKYHALVEFSTSEARERALMRALQIFGVMMAGWKEYRPVFSSDAPTRTSIFLQNIPFGTPMGELLDEVNRALADSELSDGAMELSVSGTVPREVMITNGRMELRFESFAEAAHVVARLHEHVRFMKSRRPPAGEDANLTRARALHADKLRKALRRAASDKKKSDKLAAALLAKEKERKKKQQQQSELFLDAGDDEDEEELLGLADEEEEEEEEEDATLQVANDDDEDEDAYFEAELAREAALTPEQRALREVPRPFDVTWSPAPRARNKHVYL